MSVDVLTVSSKGQVVLPAAMRKSLSIGAGAKLAAYAAEDCILLKVVRVPTAEEFKAQLDQAQAWAASVGCREEDVNEIVKSRRRSKGE